MVGPKYYYLRNLKDKMRSNDKDNRPNCDEILELSDEWRLTLREIDNSGYLSDSNEFKQILNYDSQEESILETFFIHFLQQRYEEYMCVIWPDKRIVHSIALSNTRSKLKRSISLIKNNN